MYYALKVLLSATIIVIVAEVSKFNEVIGGLIKSLPLISLLALIWLYAETNDPAKIVTFSYSTFWFVIPTLPMFLVLPYLLNRGLNFYISLFVSVIVMLVGYVVMLTILKRFGFEL